MAEYSTILIEKQDGITTIRFNRPEKRNAMSPQLHREMHSALSELEFDDETQVLVITGAGDSFCAGQDLKEYFYELRDDRRGREENRRISHAWRHEKLRFFPRPTIAAINGWCLAGGVELACWCDFRIVAENARLGLLNKRWGLSLADGGTQRLPRIVGMGNALWMIETGMQLDARRAQLIGLAQEVVPEGEALDRAMEIAQHITTYPQVGLRADRKAAIGGFGMSIEDGLQLEVEVCHPPVRAQEVVAGMASFVGGSRPEPPRPRDTVRL